MQQSKVVELHSTTSVDSMVHQHASTKYQWALRDTLMSVGICLALLFALIALGLAASHMEHDDVEHVTGVVLSASASPPEGYRYLGSLETGTGEWVTKQDLPAARSDLHAVTVGTSVYIVGGVEADAVTSTVVEFDAVFERYNTTKAMMPTPRYRFGAAAVGDKIFCVGGYTVVDGDPVASMDIYDTVTDTWSSGPAMSQARGDIAAAAAGDVVYVIGGYGVGFDMSVTGTLVEAYDTIQGTWTQLASMPTTRGDTVAVSDGVDVFVAGGWNEANGFLSTFERFSPATNSWTSLPPMSQSKGDKAGVFYDDEVFLIGGEVTSGESGPCPWDPSVMCAINEIPVHDVDAFKSSQNVWVKRAPIPEPGFRFTAAVANGAVWVFGGQVQGAVPVASVVAFFDVEHPAVFVHSRI